MKAVIVAGGFGTRLRPLTYNTPKLIVPVANRPFVLHQIELLRQHGIKEIILSLHYLSENIKNILGDGKNLGVKIYYSIEEEPLGTAGAVKNAEKFFENDLLIVFNGDTLTDINIAKVIDFHKKKKARATLTLTEVEDPTAYGLILIDSEGRVEKFLEKPSWEQVTAYTINAGIYILDPTIFKNVPSGIDYSFERHLYPDLLNKGEKIYGFVSDRYWMDIGSPTQYQKAHEAILRGEVAAKIHGTRTDGKIWIDDKAEINRSAKLLGPAIIGKEVKIDAGTKIKDFVVIGDRVNIGRECTLNQTIIWEGTKIGNNVQLDNCIIGFNCILEDEVKIGKNVVLADGSTVRKGSILSYLS